MCLKYGSCNTFLFRLSLCWLNIYWKARLLVRFTTNTSSAYIFQVWTALNSECVMMKKKKKEETCFFKSSQPWRLHQHNEQRAVLYFCSTLMHFLFCMIQFEWSVRIIFKQKSFIFMIKMYTGAVDSDPMAIFVTVT